jgi:hypothetical protein
LNSRPAFGMAALISALWLIPTITNGAEAPRKSATHAVSVPARTPDDKPNWTGFWSPIDGLLERNFGDGASASAPRSGAGQTRLSPHSPLKSPYKERYEAVLKDAERGVVTADPTASCLPPGMPRMMRALYGLEILQTPGQVTITSEWQAASRRIWTDGRSHPPLDELMPTYAGHSIGRWEGNTLVVETVGVREDVLIDQTGLPQSGNMRVVERIYLDKSGLLVDEITVDDPAVFTQPWTHVRRYRSRPDLHLQEYVCYENNRDGN